MQYRNYLYEMTDAGIRITQYLSPETTSDLLVGSQKSLLFDLEGAQAEETAPKSAATEWELEEEEYAIIPSVIDGQPVVEIGPEAFSEYGALLQRIEVPGSVRMIRDGAFKMCMSLTELILHEGVAVMERDAVHLTPLEELTLPKTLEVIGHPWELSSIHLTIPEGHPSFYTDGYGIYQKQDDERILRVVEHMQEREVYTVLDGTTIIGENAFAGNPSLKKLKLPETVHTITNSAMESCELLEQVVLPEGLRKIGNHAFSRCISLKKIHLPATLEILEEHAISDSFGWNDEINGIEEITVAADNPYFKVQDDVLLYSWNDPETGETCCAVEKYMGHAHRYDIPDGVTHVRRSAFRRADCYELTIPESMREVSEEAFKECKNMEWIHLRETDTEMYVPRNPVYRKDEVMALLETAHSQNPMPLSYDDLPEKWKKFGKMAITDKKERIRHADSPYVFDYVGYDGLFHTYLNLTDHIGMACCRLQYPVLLSEEVAEKYRAFICENFMEILEDIATREDMSMLTALAALSFFTGDNIEESMDVFNRMKRTKLLGYLMNYKQEHLADNEFDFSL